MMEQDFYRDRLRDRHHLAVLIPAEEERQVIHRVIYDEPCLCKVAAASRDQYRIIMAALVAQGAQAIILGCTEISLLVEQQDCALPLNDTTGIHARKAAAWALAAGAADGR